MATTFKSTKNIPDNYTLRKQIGANVFKKQPKSYFQYGNYLSEYYKNKSYYYYGNKESPYIAKSSGGGSAGSAGIDVSSTGIPPWIQNPNKSETEQAWNIIRAEFSERFNNLKTNMETLNLYGITMKDINDLIPENNKELFNNALDIMKDQYSSAEDKKTAMATMSYIVGVAEKDIGNNVVYTDPVTGQSYTYNDYLGNPGDQASWKVYSGDLEYSLYMLLEIPYLVTDPYQRSILESTLTNIQTGNPMSIQQGNKTIDVLELVLTPENIIKVEEQKYYASALEELKQMDTSGMNEYQYAEWKNTINSIENKKPLGEKQISYVQNNTTVGNYYDTVKNMEVAVNNQIGTQKPAITNAAENAGIPPKEIPQVVDNTLAAIGSSFATTKAALEVSGFDVSKLSAENLVNISEGKFTGDMGNLSKEDREAIVAEANQNRQEKYQEMRKNDESLYDKVAGFIGDVGNTEIKPLMQTQGGQHPNAARVQSYNPAYYQGYPSQYFGNVPGSTPLEKSESLQKAGITDYYKARYDNSVGGIVNQGLIDIVDPFGRVMYGVNVVGDKEKATIKDVVQVGLTVYDILTLGLGRGASFGVKGAISGALKGADNADEGAKGLRAVFSFLKRSDDADKADELFRGIVQSKEEVSSWWGKTANTASKTATNLSDEFSHGMVKGNKVYDAYNGKWVKFDEFKGTPEIFKDGKYFDGFNENGVPQFKVVKDYTKVADNAAAGLNKKPGQVFNYQTQSFEDASKAAKSTERVTDQGAGIPNATNKPRTQSAQSAEGSSWIGRFGLNPDNPVGITHVPMNALRDLKAGYNFATQHPGVALLGGTLMVGLTDIVSTWAFQSFYIGDTLQQASQYNISNMVKGENALAWGQSQAMLKNSILFQESVSYLHAKSLETWRDTPVVGGLFKAFDFVTAGSLTRGINQYQVYQGVITGNVAILQERGLVYGVKTNKDGTIDTSTIQYRTPEQWVTWYKTEGKFLVGNDKYGLKGECDSIYASLTSPNKNVRDRAISDWNTQANTNIKTFSDLGVSDVKPIPLIDNKTSGLVESSFGGMDTSKMTPGQRTVYEQLGNAKDVNSVIDIAKQNGVDTRFIDVNDNLDSIKHRVLNSKVGGDNEKAIWGIDRSKVYAPPVTDQGRNYFKKVETPETIKWDSKYVPQAATYGGAGAMSNYPQSTPDPSWSVNLPTDSYDRPWLNEGTPVFDYPWTTPNPEAIRKELEEEGDRIGQTFSQPTWFDQSYGFEFAELIAVINYDPLPKDE